MNIKAMVISNAARLILGGHLWDNARHLVSLIDTKTMTGAEKRSAVYFDLRAILGDVSAVLLNCAIEIATLWLRAR